MTKLVSVLKRAAAGLESRRDGVLDDWVRALVASGSTSAVEVRESCARSLDALLVRLSAGSRDRASARRGHRERWPS